MPVINKPVTQTTHKACAYQVGGPVSVHSGVRVQSTSTNHKEPYKIEQDENKSQKPRLPLKPSTKAVEVHQESVHAVSESSVRAPQELESITDWSSENPLYAAQNLRKKVQSGRNSSSENYTLAASKQVQLLVDTGACVSAIDEQFVHKTYGQFLPKMTNGSLTSVQTISGDKVPVLGKISVLLKLNGFEYSCGFHVMKNLAYDAILGRDFLQRHQARIDLETNSLTFKGSTDVRKKRKSTGVSELPVMGTYHSAIRPM